MKLLAKQKVSRRARTQTPPDKGRPWCCRLGGAVLLSLAVLAVVALLGHQVGDPTPKLAAVGPAKNPLGLIGAWLSGLLYDLFGLAAWWLPGMLALAGVTLWRARRTSPLLPLMAGWLWLSVTSSVLLGLFMTEFRVHGGRLPLGGGAGKAMAKSLAALSPPWLAWLIAVLLLMLGVVLVLASLRPAINRRPTLPTPARPSTLPPERDLEVDWPRPHSVARDLEPEQPFPAPAPEPPAASEPGAEPPVAPEPPESEKAPQIPQPSSAPHQKIRIRPRQDPATQAPAPPPERAGQDAGLYQLPPLTLLQQPQGPRAPEQEEVLAANSSLLEKKLLDFGVQGQVVEVAPGPVVTMYEFKPAPGVKISKVAGLADDLAMNLKASSIRIVAPIPGKAVIGIEIPSPVRETVFLRELLASATYQTSNSPLAVALGKDILGQPVVDDLSRMPHLLIAGATGAGKSVFINNLVLSILYKATPDQVRLLMVDPKRIELSTYNDIPHLLYPIITAPQEACAGLRWAVNEMERRYELLAQAGVRNIRSFNQRLEKEGWTAPMAGGPGGQATDPAHPARLSPLPYVLVIIDELADLMMVSSKEVEALITRLAQMARAAGIHLVLATQRPSVDVITGLIKANFPARISFQVSSRVDSRTILDTQGAEHLLGAGDMLFLPPGTASLRRLHGAFVSDREIEDVVNFVKAQAKPQYDESIVAISPEAGKNGQEDEGQDDRYADAVALVKQTGNASISHVQRRLRVGYNRAARMIEQMEQDGIVGPSDGSRPREVFIRD